MRLYSEKLVYVGLRSLARAVVVRVRKHLVDDVQEVLHGQDVHLVQRDAALLAQGEEAYHKVRVIRAFASWCALSLPLCTVDEKSLSLSPPQAGP
jgi:hypothetical protein